MGVGEGEGEVGLFHVGEGRGWCKGSMVGGKLLGLLFAKSSRARMEEGGLSSANMAF